MKLQAASKKELSRIALGTVICSAVLVGVLYAFSLVNVGTFDVSRILLGIVIGDLVAIGNFYILCLTVQRAVDMTDKKLMKAKFQVSYNFRMLLQAAWVVVALLVPQIHVVAGAVPLLFPHAIILYLQFSGRISGKGKTAAPQAVAQEADETKNDAAAGDEPQAEA